MALAVAAAMGLSAQTARRTTENPKSAPLISHPRPRATAPPTDTAASPVLQPGQTPELVIDSSVDQSQINLPAWLNIVWPVVAQIAEPGPQTPAQYELRYNSGEFATDTCTGPTWFGSYPSSGDIDAFEIVPYSGLTYELHHYIQPCLAFASAINLQLLPFEARSEAGMNLVYRSLWRQNPSLYYPITDIPFLDVRNNLNKDAVGGGGVYGELGWPTESGAQIELLYSVFGGSLKPFDHAWNAANSQADILSNLDAMGKTVNGVLPSTFLQYSLAYYANGPTGGAYLTIFTSRPLLTPSDLTGLGPVNPNFFAFPIVQRSGNNYAPPPLNGNVLWKITDAQGVVQVQGVSASELSGFALFETNGFAEGAYRVDACALETGSTTVCDATINTETTYIVVSHDSNWWQNSMFLIGNGPDYFTFDDGQAFTVLDDGGAESTSQLPGLLVLKNPQRDVVVSFAGNPPRSFTPADVSSVYLTTRRDQPYLYAAGNAASASGLPQISQNAVVLHYAGAVSSAGADGIVSPGSWATLFTWGATQLDPYLPPGGALPPQGCADGRTRVDFQTPDGTEHWAPIQYCSRGQINVQVPYEVQGQRTATVYVVLGSTRSNGVQVQVTPLDPAFFITDWPTLTPAMYDWTAGAVVAAGAPVKRGDTISLYGTGLGPTTNDPSTAQPAAPSPVAETLTPINLVLGDSTALGTSPSGVVVTGNTFNIPASFAGLTPGFVGLYQVNVTIPQSIAPGTYFVELSQGTVTGNVASLTIQ